QVDVDPVLTEAGRPVLTTVQHAADRVILGPPGLDDDAARAALETAQDVAAQPAPDAILLPEARCRIGTLEGIVDHHEAVDAATRDRAAEARALEPAAERRLPVEHRG